VNLRIVRARIDAGELASISIEAGRIHSIERSGNAKPQPCTQDASTLDACGRAVVPGFVDAHTHAIWVGNRLDEFTASLAGASYLDILRAGGGIMATVRAVRAASREALANALLARIHKALCEGTTTIEVKSGYGLTTRDELKLLEAIELAAAHFPGTLVPTALIGHALDPDQADFVERTISETLPAIHARYPTIAIDAYCEQGAWSVSDCERLFRAAHDLGHPLRVHADQFHALGMTSLAIELGLSSVDHLEVTSTDELVRLARAGIFGVMLPAGPFHLGTPYPDARSFLDAGGRLVLATNLNPGSSPCGSMPFVIALACRKLGLRFDEALRACTETPARMLGVDDRGRIAAGWRADLLVLEEPDPRCLAFQLGGNPVTHVVCGGVVVHARPEPPQLCEELCEEGSAKKRSSNDPGGGC